MRAKLISARQMRYCFLQILHTMRLMGIDPEYMGAHTYLLRVVVKMEKALEK